MDKFEAVEKQKLETHKERDLRREQEMKHLEENLRRDLQGKLAGSELGDAIKKKIEDQIIASLDLDAILNKKEDTWDKASKLLSPAIDKIGDIIINEQNRQLLKAQAAQGVPISVPEDNAGVQGQEFVAHPEPSAPEEKSFFTRPKRSFFPEKPG